MKNIIKIVFAFLILTQIVLSQRTYPLKTIRDIQYKPIDSLLLADQLQNSIPSRWTLQSSNFLGDTVRIVGVCIIPPKVLTYATFGYNMVVADTGYTGSFGYIFIIPPISKSTNPGDTVYYQSILNVEKGDIVEIVGRVWEFLGPGDYGFPTMNSTTQIVPLRDPNFTLLGTAEVPPPIKMETSDFYEGVFPGGKIKFSTGEPFESGYVELTNLTVVSSLNPTNGTVNLMDDYGNMISTYDASKWWTLRTHRDPNSPYTAIFPINTRIDTIRGWITTVSGGENTRGYRIAPVDTTDVVIGISRPQISSVRRYPVIVTPDTTARIEAVIRKSAGGLDIRDRLFFYSVNSGPFIVDTMQVIVTDSLYFSIIPSYPVGTFIRYFLKAVDVNGNSTISASGAGGGLGADTSKGFYFYTVTDGNLTIRDVQYTPFSNGRSPFVGAVTTLRGIITADTSDIGASPRTTGGTSSWYLQSGNEPASGIWVYGVIPDLYNLRKGDSVAITGTIQENFDVTRIGNVSSVEIISSGNSLPEPVKLTTGIFGPNAGNGDLFAEPYEGMLVEFDTVTVTDVWPTFADPTEFTVSDGTGSIIVRRDGKNFYSNVPNDTLFGMTIIKAGDKFSKLRGIIYYSFNRYKICPRTNADYGTFLPTSVEDKIDAPLPLKYELANNYPNPFNPKTVIEYAIPREDFVTLKVYNLLGQEVVTLKNEFQKAGRYRVTFDGSKFSSGIYFYKLQTSSFNQVKKMLLVK